MSDNILQHGIGERAKVPQDQRRDHDPWRLWGDKIFCRGRRNLRSPMELSERRARSLAS